MSRAMDDGRIEIIEESLALVRTVLLVRNRKVLERVPLQVALQSPDDGARQYRRLIDAEAELLAQAAEKYPDPAEAVAEGRNSRKQVEEATCQPARSA